MLTQPPRADQGGLRVAVHPPFVVHAALFNNIATIESYHSITSHGINGQTCFNISKCL